MNAQKTGNIELTKRNQALAAQVQDLKQGQAAIEEQARADLGMIKKSETFYQIVREPPPPPSHEHMQHKPRFWAVIPAAGTGMRMDSAIPKQYLALAGRTVIEHVLSCFLSYPRVAGITVAVASNDHIGSSTCPVHK